MGWQLLSYVAILFLISLHSVVVARFALRLRDKPGGLPLSLLMLAVAGWSFTLAFEAAATTIPAKVLWSKFEYLGVTSTPVLLLLFALKFTHREKWLKRRYVILYWIIPLVSLTLAFTNEWHLMIWTSFTPIPGSNLIIYGHGAWFWIMVTYDYLVLSTATILLLGAAFRFRHVYRRQAIILFVGMFPPWLANILYVCNLGPPGWDLTPIGFALTGLLLTWSLARLQLLDLAPVARDKVVESMRDGMLALDAQNRIVDINPAAQKLIGVDGESAIGQHVEAILAQWTSLEDRYRDAMETQAQVFVAGASYIEWRTFPLSGRGGRPGGQLIILRDVTEQKRAEEKIKRRGEELEALQEISLAITAQLELDELLQDVVERGCRLLKVGSGGIHLVDETRGDLQMVISHGYTSDYTGTRLAPGEGIAGKVLQSGAPITVDDYGHWEGRSPDWEAESITAVLSTPLKHGDQVIGILNFSEIGRAKSFDEHDVWLATLFANQAAIAIENARLYKESREHSDKLAALYETGKDIISTLELDTLLQLIVDRAALLTGADSSLILLVDTETARLIRAVGFGFASEQIDGFTYREVQDGISGWVLKEKIPTISENVLTDPRNTGLALQMAKKERSGGKSIAVAPLLVKDEVIGTLTVTNSVRKPIFGRDDLNLVVMLSSHAAIAIENARLYQAEQAARESADTLREVSRAVVSTLELDDVLSLVLRQAKRVLTYDTASILLFSGGEPAMAAVAGYEDEELVKAEVSWRLNDSLILRVMARDHRSVIIADVREDERWIRVPGAEDIRSWIGAPLLVRDEMIGALMLDSTQPGFYTAADGAIAQTLANQAAVAIENARLYQESHDRAEEQKGLAKIAALASSTLEIDELIERIMGETMRMLGSRGGMLLLLGEERDALTARYLRFPHLTEEIKASWRIPIETPGFENSIFARGGSYLCNDVEGDPDIIPVYRPHLRILKVGNFAGVALRLKDRSIGELYVGDRPADFGPKDTRLLRTIAGYVANAIENARLYEQAQHRLESLTNLNRASQVITSSLDVKDVLEQIVHLAGSVVNSDYTSVVLLDAEGRPVLGTGDFRGIPPVAQRIRSGGVTRHVLDNGQPVVVDAISDEGAMIPPLRQPDGELMEANPDIVAAGIRSFAAVPIQAKGRMLGVLFVHSRQPRAFHGQVPLLTIFANQAAVAIENARLYDETHQRTAQLEALREMGLELTAELNLDDLLHSIVSRAIDLVGGTKGGLDFYRPDRDVLEFAVHIGIDPMPSKTIFQRGEGLSGTVWESSKALIVNDYQRWEGRAALWDEYLGRSAIVGVPIHWGDEFLGVLEVMADSPRTFSQADADLLSLFATQSAIAIENARLFEAEQRRRQEAETLRQTALALTTSLDRNQVIERILIQLRQVVPYDSASVQLLRGDRLEIVGGYGFPNLPDLLGLSFPVDGDNPNTEVIRTQAIFIVADGPAVYEGFRREPHAQSGIRSWLGAPMLVGEQLVGMIALDKQEPGFYTEEHGQLALAFAAQAAIAIENARLYEQAQQEIAERKRAQEALDQKLIVLTQPVGKVGELKLTDIIDVKILQELQDRFAASYDVASLIFDDQGTPITAPSNFSDFCGIVRATRQGLERCEISDASLSRLVAGGSPATAVCRNFEDILDGAVPIFVGDKRIATWGIGQKVISELSEDKIRSYAEEIGADADQLVAAGKKLKVGSGEQFERALSFLETMASNISLLGLQNIQQAREITERQRAERALRRRATQLATVSEIGRQITSLLELDPLLDHIVNLIRQAFNYRYVSILLVDPVTGELSLRAGAGFELEPAKALRLKVGQDSICGCVAASGEPLLVDDVSQEPRYRLVEALADTRSELTVPIQVKGRVIGVLDVQSAELEGFDTDDLSTLQTLADQVSVAIENAGLYRELRNYAGQLEQRVQERTAQLQAQYARLDAILRSASDGIVVTGAGGEIIQTNPVAQAWLTQTLSPEDAARLREAVRDLARQAKGRPKMVLELTGLDLEVRAAPVAEPGMEEAAAVVDIHDVSHLKAMDRVKSRFVSNVSHELRTPITTIKLYAHLMQRTPPESEKWGQYLNALAQEADRQARLVENILQISRIDTGRLEMKPRPTSLNELTDTVTISHQVLAQDRGLTLEHRPAEPGPMALVDPERMMQVLNNLVRNSIHYTPEGGRVVVATGKAETGGRVWATVTVADTGMGIPEEELPHVFERFFRGEKPRMMQISGTGLGLAITKEIVELHGGRVTVESPSTLRRGFPRLCSGQAGQTALKAGEEGVGSTFTVWLPITD